jgi:hypothetical protein
MISVLHQIDIPYTKGERLYRGTRQGEQPQEKNGPLPLMSKGER